MKEHHLTTILIRLLMRIEMQQQQRTNLLQIATRKQSTLSPNED